MKRLAILSVLAAAAVAVPALAESESKGPSVPKEQRLSISEASARLAAQGYQVREIEADDDGTYEFEATDAKGAHVKGYAHPATGEVLRTKTDD